MAGKQKQVEEINQQTTAQGFWENQEKAQAVMGELRRVTSVLKPLTELSSAGDDLGVLLEFAEEDDSSAAELERTLDELEPRIEAMELQATMARPEDSANAFLAIQAGEGGTDASDWAEMLLRMYQRWCEIRGFQCELIDMSEAEEAGIRNATLSIRGDYAYGYLKGESGNHRLVRISPFDSAGRRQTSFAAVDITPDFEDEIDIDINWDKDVRVDTYRSGGAGGQHVNKTDSAVRLTHIPTGVVAACQNERSQHKNKATAKKMLAAKLFQLEQDKRDAEVAARRGQKSTIGFGGETIRSYVLHPEQYVKDTRSGHKHGNPQVILDGQLDEFLEAYLRWSIGKGEKAEKN